MGNADQPAPLPTYPGVERVATRVSQMREVTRGKLAARLVALLIVVVLALIGTYIGGLIATLKLEEMGVIFLAPLFGIVGTVLGFYFGRLDD